MAPKRKSDGHLSSSSDSSKKPKHRAGIEENLVEMSGLEYSNVMATLLRWVHPGTECPLSPTQLRRLVSMGSRRPLRPQVFKKSSGKRVQKSPGKRQRCSKQPAKINARGKTSKTACAVKTITALAKKMRPHPTLSSPTHHAPRSGSLFGKCVEHCGFPANEYNTHSLRVGRATDLALAGTPDHVIRKTDSSYSSFLNKIFATSIVQFVRRCVTLCVVLRLGSWGVAPFRAFWDCFARP